MTRVSHGIDRIDATFDDPNLVANAGLLLVATLTQRLGLEALIDATVRLVGRVGGARPGRKVLTLVHAMIAGARHIDHADMLRAGATAAVLRSSGDGPVDAGHVPAGVHVRSCPPARSRHRSSPRAGLGAGCRPRRRAVGDRHRLDDLSRSTASTSRAPGSATPRCSATTRSWPPAPTPVRCCTPGCAKGRPTPSAAPAGSSTSSSPGCAAPAPPAS